VVRKKMKNRRIEAMKRTKVGVNHPQTKKKKLKGQKR
jgi:hypothetical protein